MRLRYIRLNLPEKYTFICTKLIQVRGCKVIFLRYDFKVTFGLGRLCRQDRGVTKRNGEILKKNNLRSVRPETALKNLPNP